MDDQLPKYVLLAGAWILYCVLHSLLIAPSVIRWIREQFPDGYRYHRLFYNIFSILTLIPVAVYTFSLNNEIFFRWDGILRVLQAILIAISLVLIATGAAKYDFKQFAGISQIRSGNACQGIGTNCELDTSGVLGVVRHPWYTAVIVLLWARDLDPAAIIVNTVLTGYVIIGTFLEERKLIMEFGQAYREYQKEVAMFSPFKWLKSRIIDD